MKVTTVSTIAVSKVIWKTSKDQVNNNFLFLHGMYETESAESHIAAANDQDDETQVGLRAQEKAVYQEGQQTSSLQSNVSDSSLKNKWEAHSITKTDLLRWLGKAELGEEQFRVLEFCLCGKRRNVFITGSGGVGKSFVANKIIEFLKHIFGNEVGKKVALTASTGIAASHLGGTSIHSAAGFGIPKLYGDFFKMGKDSVKKLWLGLEVLFLDEVSMCSGNYGLESIY